MSYAEVSPDPASGTEPPGAQGQGVQNPGLRVEGLDIRLGSGAVIVDGVDLEIDRGEILGIVGESGSGKTTMALGLLGYAAPGVHIAHGRLTVGGETVPLGESMRSRRGKLISYIPQEPGRALNPAFRVGQVIEDVLDQHRVGAGGQHTKRVVAQLRAVGLPATREFTRRFPHQLSGGQQQRVSIGVALSCEPVVVVLDEPTTGLDVVTQATILDELLRLRDVHGISMVFVTHDIGVVSRIADRIAVMYAGRIVEVGPTGDVLSHPRHPYTRALVAASPDPTAPGGLEPIPGVAPGLSERPTGCSFAPRCRMATAECSDESPEPTPVRPGHDVRCFHWRRAAPPTVTRDRTEAGETRVDSAPVLVLDSVTAEHRSRREVVTAAKHVSFAIAPGACVALLGESGSGKSTLARAIAGLHPPASGRVLLDGIELPGHARQRTPEQRRRIQMVFQHSAEALNPRRTVEESLTRPAHLLLGQDRSTARTEALSRLDQVRLPHSMAKRYPSELSGGERQRVAIARSLVARPDVLLCDEITSALDVSVQAAVLELLRELRRELGLSMLFITHDLGVVATIADEVLVLQTGDICERGPTASVLREPAHPYTRRLLEAAPTIGNRAFD
ncbi:ABC transporter ATP-binding protein [Streptomyces sp. NPDC005811]|uniref:ABC transporter ATP-binding protein n=1 Tax=Streptomyces sp. NPDC005811 TaxID=3154565 RepID=UPI0033C290B7